MKFLKGKWKGLAVTLVVVLAIITIQIFIKGTPTQVFSSKTHELSDLNEREKIVEQEEDEILDEDNETNPNKSNQDTVNENVVEPPSAYEAKDLLQEMISDLAGLNLEYDSLGEVPELKDSLDESDYQLIRDTMLNYATENFYQNNIEGIKRIYANFDESGAFTTSIWPEVRHSILENQPDRIVYEYIVFPIYSYQTNRLFNYLGGIVTLTLVKDGNTWMLDDYTFDPTRSLDLSWDEVVIFYRDVLEEGTPEIVGETEDEYSSYFVFKLDEEYWKISKENGEVFEAEPTEVE